MASVNAMPAGLAGVNSELELFLDRMRRESRAPVHAWFTLHEAKWLGALLNRGEALLHQGQADPAERGRYADNLGHVLHAFRAIQIELQQFCQLVSSQRKHVADLNAWLQTQRQLGA